MKKTADARAEALKLLFALGGAGLGTGVLARSLLEAHNSVSSSSYDPLMHTSSIPTPLPVPIFPGPKKKKKVLQLPAPSSLAKAAEALRKHANDDGWAQRLANMFVPHGLPGDPVPHVPPQSPESQAPTTNPLKSQWGIPAAMLVAGTGLVGGWHLMGGLTNKTKTNNVDAAVSDAEEDYQKALAEQYRAALRAKKAEDTLGIDDLFDAYVKKAGPSLIPRIPIVSSLVDAMWTPINVAAGSEGTGQLRGVVDAATLASMLGAGYMTHNWVKKRNTNKILEKAVQLRARQRQFTPAPFYAVPERISGGE